LGRFFRPPLSKQMSWLLPFALLSLIPLAFAARPHLPLAAEHKALLLWGGWLLTCLIFFSFMQGIFHAYYTIMLAPPLAALVGGGFAQLWRRGSQSRPADAFLLLAAGLTLLFQIYSAFQYGVRSPLTLLPLIPLLIGAGLLWVRAARPAAYAALLASLIFIPFLWTTWTVLEDTPNVNLPTAFQATQAQGRPRRLGPLPQGQNPIQEALLEYLLTNSQDVQYLVAVPNARLGAPLVLASGRPVLYMGGFSGNDPVVDAADLAEMVAEGRLRFVLLSGPGGVRQKQEVAAWVRGSCRPVPLFSRPPGPPRPGLHGQRPPAQAPMLFRCG
jgi:4-amino-4-deoxy-L-arabinose transferase-like glycosyltransferase